MSSVIAIIPARSGSKGVIDKNIKLLAVHPLIAYSIAAARLAKSIDRVIVSTDSEAYADIARDYKAEVPFLRPVEISGDTSTDYDFVRHLLDWMSYNEGELPEYIVHLRPTTPLREIHYIDTAIDIIKKNTCATALRSVHEMSESAFKSFEIEKDLLKPIGSNVFDLDAFNKPRQGFSKTYQPNGYVDVLKTSYIIENKKLHGDHVMAFITPYVVEVDTVDDFEYLEYQVSKGLTLVEKLFCKEKNKR